MITALHAQTPYHTEARHTHPLALTPDQKHLCAVNSLEGRLSVFSLEDGADRPVLIREIPVGLEPVSVRARTNDEVWVVNELGDSVSVVSLGLGAVIGSIPVGDEPADIAFAQSQAFVSCARSQEVWVFDTASRQLISKLAMPGNFPRAMAVSGDGRRVYVSFLYSGNGTTVLPPTLASPQPAPLNPSLPAPPKVAEIVPVTDPRVVYTVQDVDVVEIDAESRSVLRRHETIGTHMFDLAEHPVTGDLWVLNSESLNLIKFEPSLRGHFIDHRVTKIRPQGAARTTYDLHAGVDYTLLPNPSAQAQALAHPSAIVHSSDGTETWIAAFNSDRIARLGSEGQVLQRIDLRAVGEDTDKMRGPRGLVRHPTTTQLYVFNKLSDTLTVINTATSQVVRELPLSSHDPLPSIERRGRNFLFDARLSGNGTMSCASCHLDADHDGLAWDLGDRSGAMLTVIGRNLSIHDNTPRQRIMHPMKGPMVTQTLRGLSANQIFHWRGDRPTLQSFNITFPDLMAGDLLSTEDIDALAAYLSTLKLPPNPWRQLDRSLPTMLNGGNAQVGRDLFNSHIKTHCVTCHALPTGSDNNIDLRSEVGATQSIKTVHLRTVYQRAEFDRSAGAVNRTGFGLLHNGTGPASDLPRGHFYVLDNLETLQEIKDLRAFVMAFDTGTAPIVGRSITVAGGSAITSEQQSLLSLMQEQSTSAAGQTITNAQLVAHGIIAGKSHTWYFDAAKQKFMNDLNPNLEATIADLQQSINAGDFLTFMAVPPAEGRRYSIDRNRDGLINQQHVMPSLDIITNASAWHLQWSAAPDWFLESSASLEKSANWKPHFVPASNSSPTYPLTVEPLRFYRLRRSW